jgi:hypothetical protein
MLKISRHYDFLIYVLIFIPLAIAYLIGVVPDTEEYLTNLPSTFLGQSLLLSGEHADWSWKLGLGAPVHFSHNFIYNPLLVLFYFFPSSLTLKLIMLSIMFLGGFFFNEILKVFSVKRLVRFVGVFTFFSCGSVHKLVFSQLWLNEMFIYFFWPVFLWVLIKFFNSEKTKDIILFSILILFTELTIYYNGHISHSLPLAIPTIIFLLINFFLFTKKYHWIVLLIISSMTFILIVPHLLGMYYEFLQFNNDAIRLQENSLLTSFQAIYIAISKPYCIEKIVHILNIPRACDGIAFSSSSNPFIGIAFFCFLIFVFFNIVRVVIFSTLKNTRLKKIRNGFIIRTKYANKKSISKLDLSLLFASVISFIFIFIDIKDFGLFFSQSSFFNDGFHIFIILFLCVSISKIKNTIVRSTVLFLQIISLILAIFPLIDRNYVNQKYNDNDPLDLILEQNFLTKNIYNNDNNGFNRVLYSRKVHNKIFGGQEIDTLNLHANSHIFHDINVANVLTKGVSLTSLQPSERLMYGEFKPPTDNSFYDSTFLSLLGIKYLLIFQNEKIYGNWKQLNLSSGKWGIYVLYENLDYTNRLPLLKSFSNCEYIDLKCLKEEKNIIYSNNASYYIDKANNEVVIKSKNNPGEKILLPIMYHKYLKALDKNKIKISVPEKSALFSLDIPKGKGIDDIRVFFKYPWEIFKTFSIVAYVFLFLVTLIIIIRRKHYE